MTTGIPIADKMEHQATQLMAALKPLVAVVKARLRQFRIPLAITAAIIFAGGAVWSFLRLGLSFAELPPGPLAMLAALALFALFYGGTGLVLLAKAAGTTIPFRKALPFAIHAGLAEALPLPGGAIVRTGALVNSGARIGQSSFLVVATAILWIAIAATGAGLFLISLGTVSGLVLAIPGFLAVASVSVWLVVRAGWKIASLTILHRLAGMFLVAIRLKLAFLVVGVDLSLANTLPFAFASIAGSAAAIAPAGLGISESLSALLANVAATAPASAFLAVALNRVVGLAVTAIAFTIIQFETKPGQPEEAHKG